MAASNNPFASKGLEGMTIFKPGVANRASIDCEWYSAPCAWPPMGARTTRGAHVHLLGLYSGRRFDRLRGLERVDVGQRVLGSRVVRVHSRLGRLGDLLLDGFLCLGHFLRGEHTLLDQRSLEALEAVVLGQQLDLFLRAVAPLVILRRVGAEPVNDA